mgnify:FL=1
MKYYDLAFSLTILLYFDLVLIPNLYIRHFVILPAEEAMLEQ